MDMSDVCECSCQDYLNLSNEDFNNKKIRTLDIYGREFKGDGFTLNYTKTGQLLKIQALINICHIKNIETSFKKIFQDFEEIDLKKYGQTRNYINGNVTKLSPYISRGLISTKTVFNNLINRNINPKNVIKFIQELAWRITGK